MKTEEQQKNKGGLGTVSAAEIFLSGQNWETINSNKPPPPPPKKKTRKKLRLETSKKCEREREKKVSDPRHDSNTQPSDLESDALPLRHRVS